MERMASELTKKVISEKEELIFSTSTERERSKIKLAESVYYEKENLLNNLIIYFNKISTHVFQRGGTYKERKIIILVKPGWIFATGLFRWCEISWIDDLEKEPDIIFKTKRVEEIDSNFLKTFKDYATSNLKTVKVDKETKSIIKDIRKIINDNYFKEFDSVRNVKFESSIGVNILKKWIFSILLPLLEKKWKIKETSKKFGL